MAVAVDVELVVAGFINTHPDKKQFVISDVQSFIQGLWNAGCGPIRLNFTEDQLKQFLDDCDNVCLHITPYGWEIDKDLLESDILEKDTGNLLRGDEKLAKSFDLFCKLRVDFRTPNQLLDATGFRFIFSPK